MENGNAARKLTDDEIALNDEQAAKAILSLKDPHYLAEEAQAEAARKDFQKRFLQTVLTAEHLLIDQENPHKIEVGGLVDEITPDFLGDLRLQFKQWEVMPDSPVKLEMFLHLEEVRSVLNRLMGSEDDEKEAEEKEKPSFDALDVDINDFF